ncbi:MAG: hypothetical protein R3E09_00090 [Novosphingobium sp.]
MTNLFMPYGSSQYLGIMAKEGVAKTPGVGIGTKIGVMKATPAITGGVVRLNAKR